MNKSYKKTSAIAMRLIVVMVIGLFSITAVQAKWSFGVIADNQDAAGLSHGLVATQTIHQIDSQFIAKGVKLVIQVGDELNAPQKGVHGDLAFAAAEAQYLYNAGIGFFPMRGNHEAQSDGGNSDLTMTMFRTNFPQTQGLSNTFGAANFSSPTLSGYFPDDLKGLSYSFDYFGDVGSARFLVIDDWGTTKNAAGYDIRLGASYPLGYSVGEQQEWISSRLDKNTRGTDHAFVLAHHNIMGAFHWDCLFGYSDEAPEQQNAFFASLFNNGVRYYTSGHEHLYNRSIFTSPDGNSYVQDINCVSAGPKFINPTDTSAWLPSSPFGPAPSPNTVKYFFGQKSRQTQISQELNNIGFYIYTIDGPQVTVDYFADDTGKFKTWPDGQTPTFNFVKKETWGYSLNGKEFRIAEGQPYTTVSDAYSGTIARILSGVNSSTAVDFENKRPFTKVVTTGWTSDTDEWMRCSHERRYCGRDRNKSHHCNYSRHHQDNRLLSNIITLWGMADFGTDQTDTFTFSMSYEKDRNKHVGNEFGIAVQDSLGNWVNAVNMNFGGTKKFFKGPWKAEYGLGAYGVDPHSKTVWAVLNYNDDFAVAADIEEDRDHRR
jgi:hypothetical protein